MGRWAAYAPSRPNNPTPCCVAGAANSSVYAGGSDARKRCERCWNWQYLLTVRTVGLLEERERRGSRCCSLWTTQLERGSPREHGTSHQHILRRHSITSAPRPPISARAPSVSRWGDLCTSRPACTIRLVRCAATCLPAIATLVSASQLRASCLGKGPGDLYLLLRAAVKPRCRGFEELVSPRRTQNPNPKFRLSCRGGCVLPCG